MWPVLHPEIWSRVLPNLIENLLICSICAYYHQLMAVSHVWRLSKSSNCSCNSHHSYCPHRSDQPAGIRLNPYRKLGASVVDFLNLLSCHTQYFLPMIKYTIRADPASGKAISEVNSGKTSIGVKSNVNIFDSWVGRIGNRC